MRRVINVMKEGMASFLIFIMDFVRRIHAYHIACAAVMTIIVVMMVQFATRDRSYNDYPIDAVLDRPACLEIIYDGNKKLDTLKARVNIDKKSYVRAYNNEFDETEVYMTLDMYRDLFEE